MAPMPLVWEQRLHPFRNEWVLYTEHRAGRPWVGDVVAASAEPPPSYDPACALCPGNERVEGRNPDYSAVYVFPNDLPPFSTEGSGAPATDDMTGDALYLSRPASGASEVVCYHPDHSRTFADLTAAQAAEVVATWRGRTLELNARDDVAHVLIFENKGALVGTSNPHPHCQIYAGNLVYGIAEQESRSAREYVDRTGRSLLADVVEREASSSRVVCENDGFLACVPWFARYAYEILILPKAPVAGLADLDDVLVADLGALMVEVSVRFDNLWSMPFPYVMAVHQAPADGRDHRRYPFHIEYHPPLRKPDTLKYLAGPEIGGGSMTNESDPDKKAAELRAVSPVRKPR